MINEIRLAIDLLFASSLLAYSPLGRGMLTGRLIETLALAKSCTPAQIALAWVSG
jgi:aryl-alcohol dehydrogenase-like predicted oxidoreductase